MRTTFIASLILAVFGCDGGMDTDAGMVEIDSGNEVDAGGNGEDAGRDAGGNGTDAGMTDAGGGGMVRLTVCNYLAWCSISINGGAASTAATQTLDVPAGTVVNLMGDRASASFIWGYWQNTDADPGPPDWDTNMAAMVTMDTDIHVLACCPFTSGSGCDIGEQPEAGPCL